MRLAGMTCTLLLLAATLGGCAPRGELAVAPAEAAVPIASPTTAYPPAAVSATTDPAPSPVPAPKPSTTATPDKAAPSPPSTATAPAGDLLACASDDDCAIKDVGSCCGARPACVRADAKTFPEEVKARCAAEGRMSTCGFTSIEGCVCQSGRCAPVVASLAPAQPVQ